MSKSRSNGAVTGAASAAAKVLRNPKGTKTTNTAAVK
jgi:hypothetical protein